MNIVTPIAPNNALEQRAAGSFGRGKKMLQFRTNWLCCAAEMPRFAQRGR
jgi:hypothetical protein